VQVVMDKHQQMPQEMTEVILFLAQSPALAVVVAVEQLQ
tara:strand:- start:86 stop:202 length:117 start_codon:yes stop_codon:yes gene_type:complete